MRDTTREIKARENEKALQQELNLTSRLASIGEVCRWHLLMKSIIP